MIKIVLIIPYFGKFSTDFKFWLKSVSTNPTVDFLLITDNVISNPPSNVKIVNKTFEETQRLIQNFFDFKINLLSFVIFVLVSVKYLPTSSKNMISGDILIQILFMEIFVNL